MKLKVFAIKRIEKEKNRTVTKALTIYRQKKNNDSKAIGLTTVIRSQIPRRVPLSIVK